MAVMGFNCLSVEARPLSLRNTDIQTEDIIAHFAISIPRCECSLENMGRELAERCHKLLILEACFDGCGILPYLVPSSTSHVPIHEGLAFY